MDKLQYLGNTVYTFLHLDGKLMASIRTFSFCRYIPDKIYTLGRLEKIQKPKSTEYA